MTRTHDVNIESTDGFLLIHNPTNDTLLSFRLFTHWAMSRENVQGGNGAVTKTWQAHHLSYDLSALV
ncbi:hypothetical protein, partial [Pseudomonas avellanae]|uniref:hypothetical protein n=1 Tax=Pseudomonas avellanae TaxID=46257 RepID=UPI001E283B2C